MVEKDTCDKIDELLEQYDGKNAYELTKKALSSQVDVDVDLNCRLAHACYILSNYCVSNVAERRQLLDEAYNACKQSYQVEPTHPDVLRWCAIITGSLAEITPGTDNEKIAYAQEFKKYLDEAMVRAPDSSVYHMRGRFYYRMANLDEEERQQAIAIFGEIPAATIDNALEDLLKAEELNAGHIDNLMYLAKCYIAKGDLFEARRYLSPVLVMRAVDEMDTIQIKEARDLMDHIDQNMAPKSESNMTGSFTSGSTALEDYFDEESGTSEEFTEESDSQLAS